MSSLPSSSGRICVVAGCTGAIGKRLLHYLSSKDFSEVRLLVRRSLPSSVLSSNGLSFTETVVSDFTDISSYPPNLFDGVSIVFCSLGSTRGAAGSKEEFYRQDHDVIVAVAKAAKSSPSVRLFSLVSSVGAATTANSHYMKTKGRIEEDCKALGFNKIAIWKPSMLVAERDDFRCGECCAVCFGRYLCCCLLGGQYKEINVDTVAKAMIWDSLQTEGGTFVFDGSQSIEVAAKNWN